MKKRLLFVSLFLISILFISSCVELAKKTTELKTNLRNEIIPCQGRYLSSNLCEDHVDCSFENTGISQQYCHSSGECVIYSYEYCANPGIDCGIGDGDCDGGQCNVGSCGDNNCDFEGVNGIDPAVNPDCCVVAQDDLCEEHDDCSFENTGVSQQYCHSSGKCVVYTDDYCILNECWNDDGDCDGGQCNVGFCNQYLDNCNFEGINGIDTGNTADCCVVAQDDLCEEHDDCTSGKFCNSYGECVEYSDSYCTYSDCWIGDGNCDSSNQCTVGVCGDNNCNFGESITLDADCCEYLEERYCEEDVFALLKIIETNYNPYHFNNINFLDLGNQIWDEGRLISLDLNSMDLGGIIPSEISNIVNLHSLHLQNNDLTGEIPSEIGYLSNLEYLYMDNNQLTGLIPQDICSLELNSLYIFNNNLCSPYPNCLTEEDIGYQECIFLCENHVDCSFENTGISQQYCHSSGKCVVYDVDYCIDNTCLIGDGDCDSDIQCDVGICNNDLNNCNFGNDIINDADCCIHREPSFCESYPTDPDCLKKLPDQEL